VGRSNWSKELLAISALNPASECWFGVRGTPSDTLYVFGGTDSVGKKELAAPPTPIDDELSSVFEVKDVLEM
jgi:hypothetical protein